MKQYIIHQKSKLLSSIRDVDDLGVLLKIHPGILLLQSVYPKYKTYQIPKKNNRFRLIEDPEKKLKSIQRNLNHFLQAWYYTIKPPNVHGFCISAENDTPKGILSNAQTHCGKPYLLNIDLQDFFHQISYAYVEEKIKSIAKKASKDTITLLTKLTTYQQRLPMGAPTSPVLSNICSIELDKTLIEVCNKLNLTYTRFADDLSFSSNSIITDLDCEIIQSTIQEQGFDINYGKKQLFDKQDTKIVTGLVVTENAVELPTNFIPQLIKEINIYTNTKEVEFRYNTGMSFKKIKLFEQEILGKINFAESILGANNPSIQQLHALWIEATSPLENFESIDWLDIPYNFI